MTAIDSQRAPQGRRFSRVALAEEIETFQWVLVFYGRDPGNRRIQISTMDASVLSASRKEIDLLHHYRAHSIDEVELRRFGTHTLSPPGLVVTDVEAPALPAALPGTTGTVADKILQAMAGKGQLRLRQVVAMLPGCNPNSVASVLWALTRDGHVRRIRHGVYEA